MLLAGLLARGGYDCYKYCFFLSSYMSFVPLFAIRHPRFFQATTPQPEGKVTQVVPVYCNRRHDCVSCDIYACYHLGLFVFFPGVFLNSHWSLSCDHGLDFAS